MKLTYKNLCGVRLTKSGNFIKGATIEGGTMYYYSDACDVCGEPFLHKKNSCSTRCSNACIQVGKKRTNETLQKISIAMTGKPGYWTGKHRYDMMGEKHWYWKGGVSQDQRCQKLEYKQWREQVFERDNYTCQVCLDDTGGNLQAHHLFRYSDIKQLQYEVYNGITLCNTCHKNITHHEDEFRFDLVQTSFHNLRRIKHGSI